MLIKLELRPDSKQLRQFGFVALAAFGLLGVWAGRPAAAVLWGVGVLSALFSVFWLRGNRPLFIALSLLAFPIGFLLSHVVLAVLFFGVLTPVGLVLRLLGRDLLERGFEKERGSYWVDLREPGGEREYFRQF